MAIQEPCSYMTSQSDLLICPNVQKKPHQHLPSGPDKVKDVRGRGGSFETQLWCLRKGLLKSKSMIIEMVVISVQYILPVKYSNICL